MNKDFKILVVDDEKNIVDVVKAYLERENFKVVTALDGEKALYQFNNQTIHLVVLDLMLPKVSGKDILKKIRSTSNIPIIMLTAKAEEDEKIEGISIGADDYVTKPFSVRELVVRVKALIRRSYRDDLNINKVLSFNNDDLIIDTEKILIKKQNKLVNLTTNEFKILKVLVLNPNQILSREQLVKKAFGITYEAFDRTVDTYIKNIRHKIEDNSKDPKYITTVYGMGYKFIPDYKEV